MSATEATSATEALAGLDRREVSSRELTASLLARIEEVQPLLNAAVHVAGEEALAAAEEADRARAAGDARPLLGLPLTIKDSLAARGMPWCSGSCAREGVVADRDATVVARLRAAGAIVLAKTNTPEYTWSYETENVPFGRTDNPYDPARTAGGSSGGEAALLAVGASVAGVGTDGFGSIRVPSHYCGTVGLRPTAGLVPETGVWPTTRDTGMLDMSCVGPMARRVADLELLLPFMAGADGVDPFVSATAAVRSEELDAKTLRVGFYVEDGIARPTDGTAAAVRLAGEQLAGLGASVEEVEVPSLDGMTDLAFGMMAADGGARARADLAPAQGRHVPQMSWLLEDLRSRELSGTEFFDLVRAWAEMRARIRALVAPFDVVLCPVVAGTAPLHGCTPGTDLPLEDYTAFSYVQTFSVAGLPAAVLPVGVEGGLPIGVQIVANPAHDHVALFVAGELERVVERIAELAL
jgi:Asp-tRNA(Asn)/Glu-tRNA(Gln) amidotransferase A subunit family amidase